MRSSISIRRCAPQAAGSRAGGDRGRAWHCVSTLTLLDEPLVERLETQCGIIGVPCRSILGRCCGYSIPISAQNRPIKSARSTCSTPNILSALMRSTTMMRDDGQMIDELEKGRCPFWSGVAHLEDASSICSGRPRGQNRTIRWCRMSPSPAGVWNRFTKPLVVRAVRQPRTHRRRSGQNRLLGPARTSRRRSVHRSATPSPRKSPHRADYAPNTTGR